LRLMYSTESKVNVPFDSAFLPQTGQETDNALDIRISDV